jgi:uncharacterized protein (TIGR03437 family)
MRLYSLVFLAASGAAFAQSLPDLKATAATKQRVDLSWTGSAQSYSVQRRPLGGAFTTISTASTTSASDQIIDPYTTYQYQIMAVGSNTPSNVVTVGPPPAGFSVAAIAPGAAGSEVADHYGYSLSVVLDGNGDPAFAFIFNDPNLDGNYVDTELRFRSWNRARYQWNNDVRVAIVGSVATQFQPSISLAYDSSTGAFAVASETKDGAIEVFTSSDGGASWTSKATFRTGFTAWGPSIALAGGNVHLAYNLETEGIRYHTGKMAADGSSWAVKVAPVAAGTELAVSGTAPSLALDSAGNPAIAYWVPQTITTQPILLFWRPSGFSQPIRIMDSQNQQNDHLAAKLLFFGTQPRVATYVLRRDAALGVGLHLAFSQDGGATWQNPVVIPPDGDSSTDYPFDYAIDSQGRNAIAFGEKSSSGGYKCGNPKLALSADLITWRTCAPADLSAPGTFSVYPAGIALIYAGNDKLYLFWRETGQNPTGAGVLMWREPLTGSASAPSLDAGSAVNGATFQPGMVPGSWAQVKGANLSDMTRTWTDTDFTDGNNLPTSLNGVQVRVNNLPAAVYYISPAQVSFQVPSGVSGTANVQVIRNGAASNSVSGPVVNSAPGLFGYSVGAKTYPSAVVANTSTVVGDPAVSGNSFRKAAPGDRIQLYATGLAPSPSGVIINSIAGLSGVTATIGTTPATVEFAGLVAVGEYQINIVVPNLAEGEYPVVIRYNGQASQAGIILPIGR